MGARFISPAADIGRNVGAKRSMPSKPNCLSQSKATATARVVCSGRFNASPTFPPADVAPTPPDRPPDLAANSAVAAATAAAAPPSS